MSGDWVAQPAQYGSLRGGQQRRQSARVRAVRCIASPELQTERRSLSHEYDALTTTVRKPKKSAQQQPVLATPTSDDESIAHDAWLAAQQTDDDDEQCPAWSTSDRPESETTDGEDDAMAQQAWLAHQAAQEPWRPPDTEALLATLNLDQEMRSCKTIKIVVGSNTIDCT